MPTRYIKSYQSKQITKSSNITLTIGLWWLLKFQNSHGDISQLILMTDLINNHCTARFIFWMFLTVPHLFYQIFQLTYGNHTNPFCGVFLKNHRYLREIFLRHLIYVMEKTSFSSYVWDVLKTSYKRRLFWDVSEKCYRCHKKTHLFWDVLETF